MLMIASSSAFEVQSDGKIENLDEKMATLVFLVGKFCCILWSSIISLQKTSLEWEKVFWMCLWIVFSAVWQLTGAILRAGNLSWLFSDIAMSGFMCGAEIGIFTSQLKKMFGLKLDTKWIGGQPLQLIWTYVDFFRKIQQTNLVALGISTTCVALLILNDKLIKVRNASKLLFYTLTPVNLTGLNMKKYTKHKLTFSMIAKCWKGALIFNLSAISVAVQPYSFASCFSPWLWKNLDSRHPCPYFWLS